MEPLPRQLGRYILEELLATGGMAELYRARLAAPVEAASRDLVIKRVLPHLARNREFIELFLDEARISVPLSHGNIAQVFELCHEGEEYFLVMEYVRGRDLDAVLQRLRVRGERMPLGLAVLVASEAARGLDYAHAFRDAEDHPAGIVHRDMSPQNILVGLQGEVKIVDFGIAKAQSRLHQTTQGIIRGKACYLSPEQAECRPLDGRSDQFSLGLVLWELLTGQRALEGETEVATLERVRAARIPPPSSLRQEVPPALDRAVLRALARSPEERFATCGQLHAELLRLQAELSSATAPAASPAALGNLVRSLFSEEITRDIAARGARAQLLSRLSPEQRAQASTLTTDEILRMGTLSMQAPPPAAAPPRRPSPGRRWAVLGLSLLLVLGVAAGLGLGWDRLSGHGSGEADAGAGPDGLGALPGEPAPADADEPDASPDAGQPPAGDAPGDAAPSGAEAAAPPVEFGTLHLNASPWAYVELDGRRLSGETPLFGVRASAGPHRLRFFNPELKIERIQLVTVRAGQTQTVSVELLAP